ncbi:MAG: BatD family protein [Paludibacteraceae bacterium]
MKQTAKILFILHCALCTVFLPVMAADEVEFRAQAPAQVIVGKPFQLTYTVNQRARDLKAPEMADFDVLAGPYSSSSGSTTFVNGKRTSTYTQTYTYTLMAQREGTFTIPPADIKVSGERHQSNGVRITVLPPDEQPAAGASQGGNAQQSKSSQQASSDGSVSSENLFIRTIVSKTRVHEQEAVLLSYKLYFAGVDVAQFTNNTKIPEFTGFLKQDLEQGDIQTELEHYNGRNYQTAVLYRTLLYPQHAGDIQIDPATFEAVLRVQTRAQVRSIFDDFFGTYTNVTKTLKAPGTTIHVEALPKGKPAGFAGGVGHFTLSSNISQTEMQANEAVTLRLTIQGTGNMKLLKTPTVDWPEGFEPYDPKVNNNFKATAAGMSGTKTIEYLAIPRAAGEYTLPPITFSYYDTQEDTYKTLSTPEYTLHVQRGAGDEAGTPVVNNYVNKEDIKTLGTDIRYIYTGNLQVAKPANPSAPMVWQYAWAGYVLPLLIACLLFGVFHKRIKENADASRVRSKRANKVAQKRLKKAAQLMKTHDSEAFYTEIERALWMYLSDRLSVPTADLNKDNIASILRGKGVGEDIIAEVNRVLSDAEFARYAPSAAQSKEQLYTAATRIIDQLESKA